MLSTWRKSPWLWVLCLIAGMLCAIICAGRETAETAFSPDRASAPVLILDAGHGGADGGAVAADGTEESDINLDIALRMRELCRLFGVGCVMTRESEELDYPPEARSISQMKVWDTRSRVALINSVENGFLLSIHQNSFLNHKACGPQVFHNADPLAAKAAAAWQEALNGELCPNSRRVAASVSPDINIMANARCPAVLVECGFLSHRGELEALKTETYRTKIATILMATYLRFWEGPYES